MDAGGLSFAPRANRLGGCPLHAPLSVPSRRTQAGPLPAEPSFPQDAGTVRANRVARPRSVPRIVSSVRLPARRVGERVGRRAGSGRGSTSSGRFRIWCLDASIEIGGKSGSAVSAIRDSVEEGGDSLGPARRHRNKEHEERLGILCLRLPQHVDEEPDGEYACRHERGGP